mgnify:CR=1 FL=1
MVEAALAKDPQRRPRADELLARLTSNPRTGRDDEFGTAAVLAQTWPVTEATPVQPPQTSRSLLLEPEAPGPPRPRRGMVSRRTATVGGPVLAVVAAALVLVLATGHFPKFGPLTANQQQNAAAAAFGTYPDHEQRGVSQTVDRVVASGNTIVTMGSQTSDGLVRQQFFASADGGATWRLASVHAPGGGPAPLGHVASRLAGGPGGWLAVGPQAIWTSPDGLNWTLAASHGISPQLPGDQLLVLNNTARGFLAAGEAATAGGGTQTVIWTSRDGLNWQRKTAAQLGLTALGGTAQGIVYAAAHGPDTVISGGVAGGGNVSAAWLSTDGGSTWAAVTIPADHDADVSVTGLGSDGSGLIAVRPGHSANGGPDGVAYFSPNGHDWQYAGTVDAAGGWSPGVVKGSGNGFVVTGTRPRGRSWPTPARAPAGPGRRPDRSATPAPDRCIAPRWARAAPSSPSAPPPAQRSASSRCSCRQRRRVPGGMAPGTGQHVVDAGLLAIRRIRLPGTVRADQRDARPGWLARRGRAGADRAQQISALVSAGSGVSGIGTVATGQSQQALTLSLGPG